MVDEPTVEQTITMLRGLKSKYELHHSITIRYAPFDSFQHIQN